MVLLGDEAQLEARFGPFGDSANLDARSEHGLHRTYHRLGNHFGRTPNGSCGISFQPVWRLLLSVQDRCMVGSKRTIGSENLLDTLDGTPR